MGRKSLKKRSDERYRKSINTPEGIIYVYGHILEELNNNYIDVQIKLKRGVKIYYLMTMQLNGIMHINQTSRKRLRICISMFLIIILIILLI